MSYVFRLFGFSQKCNGFTLVQWEGMETQLMVNSFTHVHERVHAQTHRVNVVVASGRNPPFSHENNSYVFKKLT